MQFWTKSEFFIMFIYFLSDWGRISNFSDPNYLKVLKFLSSKAQFSWCKLGSSPFFFSFKKGKAILVYYCGWPKERSYTAQHSLRPVRIMELCVLWYLSFQLPGDGQELILRENGHRGGKGELSSEEDKVQHSLVILDFDSTGCSKFGVVFLLENWILSPLSVAWAVCRVEPPGAWNFIWKE